MIITNFAKLSVFIFLLIFSLTGISYGSSALEIMTKVDARYTGDSAISDWRMILIDKKDRKRVREIEIFSKEYKDVDKSISFFKSPGDVKGTSYMSYNWESTSKEDDSWLYLPALQKVNRIASTDRSGSFMGSDFTYSDIDGFELQDFNYKLVKELNNYNVLEINLETGRHHQIRTQLSNINSPVKGDVKYGAKRPNKDLSICLHSYSVNFIHPVTKKQLIIKAGFPELKIWNSL